MDIQTIFYTLASIFLLGGILLIIGAFIFLWRVERSIRNFKTQTAGKVMRLIEEKKYLGIIPILIAGFKLIRNRAQKKTS